MSETPRPSPHAPAGLAQRLRRNRLSRRDTLWLLGASSGAAGLAVLSGCAVSPVTGERILVGMSEAQERSIDAQVAPHQFSQDLGAIQDRAVNAYVSELGQELHQLSHRPDMPYNYRVLNANYVNAYTFPGGAMGVTRGIMAEMDNEAQLAALLGHEIGHVNARHAAQRQGQALVGQLAVAGLSIAAQAGDSTAPFAGLIGLGGQIGASAMLASYSRDNEREADALGQAYMVQGGYPASGMTELHQLLLSEQKSKPGLLQTMFSSHPMPAERVEIAQRLADTTYAGTRGRSTRRERYMDRTASVRRLKPTITACGEGEMAMARKQLPQAQSAFQRAVRLTPDDYASNVLMAQCLIAQQRHDEAQKYARTAQQIYPTEAQAHKIAGVAQLAGRDPQAAYASFAAFERMLPGDPGITFLQGISAEAAGNRALAARHYQQYVQRQPSGGDAQFAASRLKAWGVVR